MDISEAAIPPIQAIISSHRYLFVVIKQSGQLLGLPQVNKYLNDAAPLRQPSRQTSRRFRGPHMVGSGLVRVGVPARWRPACLPRPKVTAWTSVVRRQPAVASTSTPAPFGICIPRQVSRLGRSDKSIESIPGSRPAPTAHCIQLLVELSTALPIRERYIHL